MQTKYISVTPLLWDKVLHTHQIPSSTTYDATQSCVGADFVCFRTPETPYYHLIFLLFRMKKNSSLVALMGEYRRATVDYLYLLSQMSIEEFLALKDPHTPDPDCRSIQGVTFHVIQSGYTYANYIGSLSGQAWHEYRTPIESPSIGITNIEQMLDYTDQMLDPLWYQEDEQLATYSILARWGVQYDLEQLLEHAIVHILRHRRQVERFLTIG
ncbi:MAG: DinB family protein [Chitinophagales bacterium]|nr:DinB family protein [Chitinophagales bacterium]HNI43073.1 hypothetical protein [Chitinophagales bacterium]HNL05961.1 hypothetical protein [Chitinophagales bacterium]